MKQLYFDFKVKVFSHKMSRRKNRISIPLFKTFAEEYEEDNYWKKVFYNSSTGKFPKGISFIPNVIYYKEKNGAITSYTLSSNIEEAYKQSKEIFMDIMKVKNSKNKTILRADTWKYMKIKHRNMLLRNYIYEKQREYCMTDLDRENFFSIIIRYQSMDVLKNNHFIVENSKLVAITGVEMVNGVFTFPPIKKSSRNYKEGVPINHTKINYTELMNKYIKSC